MTGVLSCLLAVREAHHATDARKPFELSGIEVTENTSRQSMFHLPLIAIIVA